MSFLSVTFAGLIREQDPLKQGLKLRTFSCPSMVNNIREQDPLKQGLKQKEDETKHKNEKIFVSKIH